MDCWWANWSLSRSKSLISQRWHYPNVLDHRHFWIIGYRSLTCKGVRSFSVLIFRQSNSRKCITVQYYYTTYAIFQHILFILQYMYIKNHYKLQRTDSCGDWYANFKTYLIIALLWVLFTDFNYNSVFVFMYKEKMYSSLMYCIKHSLHYAHCVIINVWGVQCFN